MITEGGGMVAQWLAALLPHSKKVLGLIPSWGNNNICVSIPFGK